MGVGQRLKALPDMKEIKFTNKDQAMKEFRERLGDQAGILDAVNGNPLPSSYQLSFANPEALKSAAAIVSGFQEVESVQYGQDIIEQLYKVSQAIRLSGIILIAFLAGAELFIISNTIRLTVFARRPALRSALHVARTAADGRPQAIVMDTVKGRGVSFMEDQVGWHGSAPNAEQAATARAELAREREQIEKGE